MKTYFTMSASSRKDGCYTASNIFPVSSETLGEQIKDAGNIDFTGNIKG